MIAIKTLLIQTSENAVRRNRAGPRTKAGTRRGSSTKKTAPESSKIPYSQSEAIKLLENTESVEERVLMFLGLTTGLRASEIISIEPINFDFSKGLLRIWDRRKHRYRTVYLADELISELRLLIDTKPDNSGPRLFPYTAKTIEARFQKRSLAVFGHSRSWEAVRRTYISVCARLDVPIGIVVENTGDPATTIVKYYLAQTVENPRPKVNSIQLYPGNIKTPLKSDELKRILEGPYVEKINSIMMERALTGKSGSQITQ